MVWGAQSRKLARVVGRDQELRAGIMGGHLSTEWASGLIPIPKRNHGVAGVQASLLHDSLDSHPVPQNGLKLDLRFFSPQDVIGSYVAYDRLWGQFLTAASNSRGTLLVDLQGGTDLGNRMPYYAHFYLGGLRHLSGYHVDRIRGSTFGLASVGWLHRLGGGTLPVASRAYLGFWFDTGNTWYDTVTPRLDDLIHSGAVSLLIETPLWPLHLGYGRPDRGHSAFHLDFGIHLGVPVNKRFRRQRPGSVKAGSRRPGPPPSGSDPPGTPPSASPLPRGGRRPSSSRRRPRR